MSTARRLSHPLCLASLLLFGSSSAKAQQYLTQAGAPTFTSADPVEFGFVNLGNGNLYLTIPIASFPQRGKIPFSAALVYDSRIWQVVSGSSNTWQPTNVQTPQGSNSQGGWRFVTSADAGTVTFLEGSQTCVINKFRVPSGNNFDSFVWNAPDGTQHSFPVVQTRQKLACGVDVPTSNGFASDSSGYQMFVASYDQAAVYAPDGTEVFPSVKDTNGNFFSKDSNGNVIDTLGRKPITSTVSGAITTYAILNSQGSTSSVVVTTESLSVSTAFGQSAVTDFSGPVTVIKSIKLPDGNSYTFGYDSYGELDSITLPTGGVISYAYGNFADGLGDKNRWVTSHTSSGGTTTYGQAVQSLSSCASGVQACQSQTVTKPNGLQAKILQRQWREPAKPR